MRCPNPTRRACQIVIAGVCCAAAAAFIAGCTPVIPPGSRLMASGKVATATAPQDGMVYVVEKEANEVLYCGRVKKGDSVSVQPEESNIKLNGQTAEQRTMRLDHTYEIRFSGDP